MGTDPFAANAAAYSYAPPDYANKAPGQGGGFMSMLSSGLNAVPGVGSALGALGALAGGMSPSSSTGPITAGGVSTAGWGALNSPFVFTTGSNARSDTRADQTAPTSLDQRQTQTPTNAAASMFEGSSLVALLGFGILGAVMLKAVRK